MVPPIAEKKRRGKLSRDRSNNQASITIMSSETPEVAALDTPEQQPEQQSEQQPAEGDGQPMIDPSLMEIATQPAVAEQQSPKVDAAPSHQEAQETHDERLHTASADDRDFIFSEPHTLGITESIAQAPDPKPGDFMPPRLGEDEGIDLEALEGQMDDDMPGSPTAKLMRAIAPPLALQSQPIWPAVSLVLVKNGLHNLHPPSSRSATFQLPHPSATPRD